MKEPLHSSQDGAIAWVRDNTQDSVYIDWTRQEVVRITENGAVLILKFVGSTYYWESLRQEVSL